MKLDESIIVKLSEDGLFEYFNAKEKTDAATQDELIKLSTKAYDIFIKDNHLYNKDDYL